ncbi:MAG TPA: DUF433 domain-containing protein [Tepidisphaeraceae bacterium]|jgi:uncharacterized protein (DUF433 family)|nr:DUF433 domain-containing protein [Tepidisphaeraceae bacterium]
MARVTNISSKQHITSIPGVCGGKPCVAGTRIRVWDVAMLAQAGESPDDIIASFPQLTLSAVHAALAYYYDNRETIEREMADAERFAEELRRTIGPGPLEQRLADSSPSSPSNS